MVTLLFYNQVSLMILLFLDRQKWGSVLIVQSKLPSCHQNKIQTWGESNICQHVVGLWQYAHLPAILLINIYCTHHNQDRNSCLFTVTRHFGVKCHHHLYKGMACRKNEHHVTVTTVAIRAAYEGQHLPYSNKAESIYLLQVRAIYVKPRYVWYNDKNDKKVPTDTWRIV